MAVDPETQKFLDEVKKGKPRWFVMICKGAKIISLIVYKKGTVEKFKKQAKEEGKGQFYHGVVDGKGVDITFKLQRGDGFERPPGKDLILKDFLKTEAGMKCRPVYEIVDELPIVDESDESDGSESQAAVPTESESQASATADESGEAEIWRARFDKLQADMSKVLQEQLGDTRKISAVSAFTQEKAETGNFVAALKALDMLESLVKAALEAPPTAPPTPGSGPPPPNSAEWDSLLTELTPKLKRVLTEKLGDVAQIASLFKQAKTAQGTGSPEALSLLQHCAQLVEAALAGEAARVASEPAGDSAAWNTLFQELTPKLKQVLTDKLGDVAQIASLFKQAKSMQANAPGQALVLLQQCAALVGTALASVARDGSTSEAKRQRPISPAMAFKQSRLTWAMAKDTVQQDLRRVKDAILAAASDESAEILKELEVKTEQLYEILGEKAQNLQYKLDENVESQNESDQQGTLAAALDAIRDYAQYVETDPLVNEIDDNPFDVKVAVKSTLSESLKDLENKLKLAQ